MEVTGMFALFALLFLISFFSTIVFVIKSLVEKKIGRDIKKSIKIAWISLAVCIVSLIMMIVALPPSEKNDEPSDSAKSVSTEVSPTTDVNSTETTEVYAEDEVVNQFILDYSALTKSEFTDIEKGNICTKYHAYSYGYYCELLHASNTDKINVTINETNENVEDGVAGMRDIFHDVVKTIDHSLSDDEVYTYFDRLVSDNYLKEGDKLGTVSVTFVPDTKNSRGHIEIGIN
ncbi:MAG: hypothetical protein K6G69_03980 [Lachnospiraceae bacterium]|nr:hypothetical protein [Lachnospiraceae bacterium]